MMKNWLIYSIYVTVSKQEWHQKNIKWCLFGALFVTFEHIQHMIRQIPGNIYLFKFINRNAVKGCELCSKFTRKAPEWSQWSQWHRSGVFIFNFEHISLLFLVFLSLNSSKQIFTKIIKIFFFTTLTGIFLLKIILM